MQMVDALTRRAILCIEKDEARRAVLSDALSGYELVFTANAFETIRSMNTRAFDGYVVDFWLPDWSGPQLCRAIRDLDPHCPVVFCTAADSELSRQRAMRAGASAYFVEPVNTEALRDRMNSLLSRADAASLSAKADMERAVETELVRWAPRLAERSNDGGLAAQSLERTARVRAHKAFLAAGGTRAHFERWWPHVFGSGRANNGLVAATGG
jgi:two-component system response regulator PilR (NtrC family)/two-component system KDP operon response regulator KdpE